MAITYCLFVTSLENNDLCEVRLSTFCTQQAMPFVAENASKLGASKLLHGINKQQDDGLMTAINSVKVLKG